MLRAIRSIPFQTRVRIVLAAALWFLVFGIWWVAYGDKCSMAKNLYPMLIDTVQVMSAAKITYWMDYGTLLGLYRDHGIIPWEFDLDMGILHDTCEQTAEILKRDLRPKGYHIYGQQDYIPQKANWLLGHSPYLHTPCIRIYEKSNQYSVDIYWYDLIPPQQIANGKNTVNNRVIGQLKDIQDRSQNIMCNDEGYTDEIPGGCRYESETLPITYMTWHDVEIPLPADSNASLTRMYGPDWHKPRPKGYKVLLCSWFPTSSAFTTTAFMALAILTLLYVYYGHSLYVTWKSQHQRGAYSRVPMERNY